MELKNIKMTTKKQSAKIDVCLGICVFIIFSILFGIFSLDSNFYGI